jgi:hypothetical protein
MANRTDYTDALEAGATSGRWQTARNVDPEDVNRLTHQLRYQAARLGLEITIATDTDERTVSFKTWRLA